VSILVPDELTDPSFGGLLLLDDDWPTVDALLKELEALDIRFRRFTDIASARRSLLEQPPAAILAAHGRLGGADLYREIRAHPVRRERIIPVLLTSRHPEWDDVENLMPPDERAAGFLPAPYDATTVLAALSAMWTLARDPAPAPRRAAYESPQLAQRFAAWEQLLSDAVGSNAFRLGNEVVARVPFELRSGDALEGVLRAWPRTAVSEQLSFELGAELPKSTLFAALVPQRGLAGLIGRFTERRLGDAELDAAWVVNVNPDSADWVRHLRDPLLGLAELKARVTVEADRAFIEAGPVQTADLARLAQLAVTLWQKGAEWLVNRER
jgi:DNA-binding response OmpR family regulator